MPDRPQIETLSLKHRNRLFLLLVLTFLTVLPLMIFYSTGYRLDLTNEERTIVTTGGIYVNTTVPAVEVYLDGEPVEPRRLLGSTYYLQNVTAGQHRVVFQRPDLTTWVKELPVDSRVVIGAAAFNMPAIPHLRPITEYVTATGTPVYVGVATSTDLFTGATTTVPVVQTMSKRTASYTINAEYDFVKSLFGSSSTSSRSVLVPTPSEVKFRFSTTSEAFSTTSTETIIERRDIRLVEHDSDLWAVWVGNSRDIPYYFCIIDGSASSTALRYGQHVADAITSLRSSTTTPLMIVGDRLCRPEIKIDRLRKDVYFYDFFPNSSDLVLLQLEDGLYVTEIDDRSWQNVQRIYSGTNFQTVVENGVIYVHDGDHYFEVITEIEPS